MPTGTPTADGMPVTLSAPLRRRWFASVGIVAAAGFLAWSALRGLGTSSTILAFSALVVNTLIVVLIPYRATFDAQGMTARRVAGETRRSWEAFRTLNLQRTGRWGGGVMTAMAGRLIVQFGPSEDASAPDWNATIEQLGTWAQARDVKVNRQW